MESSISVQSKSLLNWLFDQIIFTINSDVKPSCRTNVLIWSNWHLKSKTKPIKENSIRPCRAAHLREFIWNIFTSPRWDPGRFCEIPPRRAGSLLVWKNYTFIRVSKEGAISPRRASLPNQASSPPYKQPLRKLSKNIQNRVKLQHYHIFLFSILKS